MDGRQYKFEAKSARDGEWYMKIFALHSVFQSHLTNN